jgi:hypothetical protein
MRSTIVLPVSPPIYSAIILLYFALLFIAVIVPTNCKQKGVVTLTAVAAGIAIWQLTMLTVVGTIPETAIDIFTIQAASIPPPIPVETVYPAVKLSAFLPIVPGILAIRPLNTLIKERLRHERAT